MTSTPTAYWQNKRRYIWPVFASITALWRISFERTKTAGLQTFKRRNRKLRRNSNSFKINSTASKGSSNLVWMKESSQEKHSTCASYLSGEHRYSRIKSISLGQMKSSWKMTPLWSPFCLNHLMVDQSPQSVWHYQMAQSHPFLRTTIWVRISSTHKLMSLTETEKSQRLKQLIAVASGSMLANWSFRTAKVTSCSTTIHLVIMHRWQPTRLEKMKSSSACTASWASKIISQVLALSWKSVSLDVMWQTPLLPHIRPTERVDLPTTVPSQLISD